MQNLTRLKSFIFASYKSKFRFKIERIRVEFIDLNFLRFEDELYLRHHNGYKWYINEYNLKIRAESDVLPYVVSFSS